MKSALRSVFETYPGLLKNNRLWFTVQKYRAYSRVRLRSHLARRPELAEALARDGVVVVPGYLPPDQVASMLGGVEEALARVGRGELKEHVFTVQPTMTYRIAKADEVVPATRPFFDDVSISSTMEAVIAPGVASYRHEIDYRFGVAEMAQADVFHFDNWRPICKAFLYLTDVGPKNAPFAYLKGSHQMEDWKVPHALAFDAYGSTGRYGHFFAQEVRELRRRHDWEEVVCTGPAGTLILADFRGLHRGTPLQEGRRILLNNTFDLMNPPLVRPVG